MPTKNDKPWGFHCIIDFSGCPVEKINDRENILAWKKELIEAIGMVAYGEGLLEFFENDDPSPGPGYTMLQLILTSSITAHFCNTNGGAYIDIFSCKPFQSDVALKICKKYFSPKKVVARELARGGVDKECVIRLA